PAKKFLPDRGDESASLACLRASCPIRLRHVPRQGGKVGNPQFGENCLVQERGPTLLVQTGVEEHGVGKQVRVEAETFAVFDHKTRRLQALHILSNLQRATAKNLGSLVE